MATLHFTANTTSTPEQFLAALTDFGPGRSEIFGNSADDYLKLHDAGPDWADVTEGSGGVWERLHYDWSDPNRVVMTTTDSNTWGGASGHTYTFTPQADGTTELDAVEIDRDALVETGNRIRRFAVRYSDREFPRCKARTPARGVTRARPIRRRQPPGVEYTLWWAGRRTLNDDTIGSAAMLESRSAAGRKTSRATRATA